MPAQPGQDGVFPTEQQIEQAAKALFDADTPQRDQDEYSWTREKARSSYYMRHAEITLAVVAPLLAAKDNELVAAQQVVRDFPRVMTERDNAVAELAAAQEELARAKNGARWLSERLESAVKREERLEAEVKQLRESTASQRCPEEMRALCGIYTIEDLQADLSAVRAELEAAREEIAADNKEITRLCEALNGERSTSRIWLEERDLALADVYTLREKVGEKSKALLQRQCDAANHAVELSSLREELAAAQTKVAEHRAEIRRLDDERDGAEAMASALSEELATHQRECCTRSGARGSLPDDAEERLARAWWDGSREGTRQPAWDLLPESVKDGYRAVTKPVLAEVRSWLSPVVPAAAEPDEGQDICQETGLCQAYERDEPCWCPPAAVPVEPPAAAEPSEAFKQHVWDGSGSCARCNLPERVYGVSCDPPAGASPETPEEMCDGKEIDGKWINFCLLGQGHDGDHKFVDRNNPPAPAAPTGWHAQDDLIPAEGSREICTCPGIVTPLFGGEVCMRCSRPYESSPPVEPPAASEAAKMLEEFHVGFGYGRDPDSMKLRRKLTAQEAQELLDAFDSGNMWDIAHELADVVYVCYGSAWSMNIDLDAALRAVHKANMTKIGPDGPVFDADGKVQKGPHYRAPDMSEALGGRPQKCPRCDSFSPSMHPAMNYGGEVQVCPHVWHEGRPAAPGVAPTAEPRIFCDCCEVLIDQSVETVHYGEDATLCGTCLTSLQCQATDLRAKAAAPSEVQATPSLGEGDRVVHVRTPHLPGTVHRVEAFVQWDDGNESGYYELDTLRPAPPVVGEGASAQFDYDSLPPEEQQRWDEERKQLRADIQSRRSDPEFMQRLADRISEDEVILARLAEGDTRGAADRCAELNTAAGEGK